MIELALVLTVFVTLVFGTIDLGIAVLRYHMLAQGARQGARQAVVHGALADRLGVWEATEQVWTGSGDEPPIVAAVRPSLMGMDLSRVTVRCQWPDGGNEPGNAVEVTVSTTYTPMMTFIFGGIDIPLAASSKMTIAH